MVRSSSRKRPCSPSSPSVYWRGARLRELLKCTFPFPPPPPRHNTNSCPSRARSVTGIADCRLPIGNCSEFDVGGWTVDVACFSSCAGQTTGIISIILNTFRITPPQRTATMRYLRLHPHSTSPQLVCAQIYQNVPEVIALSSTHSHPPRDRARIFRHLSLRTDSPSFAQAGP